MKNKRIVIIAVLIGVVFAALIYIIMSYTMSTINMRKEQFDAGVNRSLFLVTRMMEMDETYQGLKEDLHELGSKEIDEDLDNSLSDSMMVLSPSTPLQGNNAMVSHASSSSAGLTLGNKSPRKRHDLSDEAREELKKRYIYQQDMLNKVIYTILAESNEVPFEKRINFKNLDNYLKTELGKNGIDIPYHFTVSNSAGKVLYRCPDYTDEGADNSYTQVLLPNNSPQNTGLLTVTFPSINRYIYKSSKYIVAAEIFVIILIVMYIYMIRMMINQRRLDEIKNDFVNNMTHELKTPVASISLASQMLGDESVPKTPAMTAHLSGIINTESQRLKQLIDRVLQTSLLAGKNLAIKQDMLDINTMIEDVCSTFALKVEEEGGSIETDLAATKDRIIGDEVHITNVIFNLMENAVKYRREDVPLQLKVSTENKHNKIVITVADNGIGIRKDSLKKVFDKFYRVHSGNTHDVKGFGLGLAYVKNMIQLHHGNIHAESKLGQGTKFIITLPTIKE